MKPQKKAYQVLHISLLLVFVLFLIALMILAFGYRWQHMPELISSHRAQKMPLNTERDYPLPKDQRVVRILTVDGGGVRGIIPLEVLIYLEKKSGMPISNLFDVFAGSSTGAIIVSMLNVPNKVQPGQPKYTAQQILTDYTKMTPKIFATTWYRNMMTLNGLIAAKYSNKARDARFQSAFSRLRINDLLKPVIFNAYALSTRKPIYFSPWDPLASRFFLQDLLSGSTAAPTFFPPAKLLSLDHKNTLILVDGAIYLNDPALLGFNYAIKQYPGRRYLIISLGTGDANTYFKANHILDGGMLQWLPSMFNIIATASSDNVQVNIHHVINSLHMPVTYYRFNISLDKEQANMANVTPENLEKLKSYGQRIVEENKAQLDALANLLKTIGENSQAPNTQRR